MNIYEEKQTDIIHETSVDFVLRPCNKEIHIVQYDKSLPIIKVELFSNGRRYSVSNNAVVNIRLTKLDNTFVYKTALGTNIDKNIVYFEVDEQMATKPGRIPAAIEVVETNKVACSSPIQLVIGKNPIQEGQIESHDYFPIIYEIEGLVADHEERLDVLESNVTNVLTTGEADAILDGSDYFYNKLLKDNVLTSVRSFVNSKLSSVYKSKGSASTQTLNSMTKTSEMHGYVYNVTNSGNLTNGDEGSIYVNEGDNVALLWENNTWKWDALASYIDLSNYVDKNSVQVLRGYKTIESDEIEKLLTIKYLGLQIENPTLYTTDLYATGIEFSRLKDHGTTVTESLRLGFSPINENRLFSLIAHYNSHYAYGVYELIIPQESGTLAVVESIVKHQRTVTIAVNPLTNLNGYTLSSYTATFVGDTQYPYYLIQYNGSELTEAKAKDYMMLMTGSDYVPEYNQQYPKDSVIIFPDGSMWKPQYSNGSFRLYRLQKSYNQTLVDLISAQTISGVKTFSSDSLRVNDIKNANGILFLSAHTGSNNGFDFNGTILPSRNNNYDIGSSSKHVRNIYVYGDIRKNNSLYGISLPDMSSWTSNKEIATKEYVDTNSSSATNIENGATTGSLEQVFDGSTFSFVNPNSPLGGTTVNIGIATGTYASMFGGKGRVEGKRGFVNGTQVVASGNYSHAEGNNTHASGANSHAEGIQTYASGSASHAEGSSTTATETGAHSEGYGTHADGVYTHAEGSTNYALGDNSHAEGGSNIIGVYSGPSPTPGPAPDPGTAVHAEGMGSHAEGNNNTITGSYSHAEGQGNTISSNRAHAEGNGNTVSGLYAHAEGNNGVALGEGSHSEGLSSHAVGNYSHAEGAACYANGLYSHAAGQDSAANGTASFASGFHATANRDYQTVIGKYNLGQEDTLFEVGNGTSNSSRSNAFEVYSDGTLGIPNFNSNGVRIGTKRIKCINGVLTVID